ncbi:MAG: hypothetical protein H6670_03950 [Anaerolineaceae bacterium]|nr:hypothetical protein [Anaerolineaceae bacterium]
MFKSFENSWQLAKASWAVLRANKQLMWFPIMAGISMIVVFILFFIPAAVLTGIMAMVTGAATSDNSGGEVLGFILMFFMYLVSYSVGIFFNTALIGSALHYMDGETPTVSSGLALARSKMGTIIGYALISATVGVILNAIRERSGILGNIISGLIGMAWNLATFLVVPILALNDISPIDAIKQSASLFKKTWGEQVVGNFSIGAVIGLLALAVLIGGGLIMALLAATKSGLLIVIGIVIFVLAFIIVVVIGSAMDGIYKAALYRYAETGQLPSDFDIDMIQNAFRPKKKKN